jgi:hypothetical protein
MAVLSPSMEVIKRQKVQPTEGEWALLYFLLALDDSYEIYFQSFLNGDNPDFVIMKKDFGVLIIEVKDWKLENYVIDKDYKWRLKKDNTIIKSPLKQVESYKKNLFNLHIKDLLILNITNKRYWTTVNCAVYFHNTTEEILNHFLLSQFQQDKYYRKNLSFFGLFGKNSLIKTNFEYHLDKIGFSKKTDLFDEKLYVNFQRYLKAPIHQIEDGKEIIYTNEQKELIRSEIRPRRKIRGTAGCGKTLVLAKRAVNAHLRTGSRVLILTYNLSLVNYIRDRISDVREEFYWDNFYIINYHQFFKIEANNYNLVINSIKDWENVEFFEQAKNQIQKFEAVFIDEIQDYKQEWIDIINRYFFHSETEWVVFGDEKQDIYLRKLRVRNIPADWNRTLNKSYRFTGKIANIAIKFQKTYFDKLYELDDIKILSTLDFETRILEYHFLKTHTVKNLYSLIYSVIEKHKIHSSDIGILCSTVEILRELDFLIRTDKNEKTKTTFESQEEYELIVNSLKNDLIGSNLSESEKNKKIKKDLQGYLEHIRRGKKLHFWMKTGTVKLSTIHSFKGWEIDTLFLFIENEEDKEDEFTNAELIYTGITRARKNLIVFNLGNLRYHDFFKTEIES